MKISTKYKLWLIYFEIILNQETNFIYQKMIIQNDDTKE